MIGEDDFWDLAYRKYADPGKLFNLYIVDGRFGELVEKIIDDENKRLNQEAEKENDRRWWELYLHASNTENKSYLQWKKEMISSQRTNTGKRDADMTEKDKITLLKKLFPNAAKL